MTKRIKNIFQTIEKPLDAILLKNGTTPFLDDNFFYVTALEKGIFEGCLAVSYPDGGVDLVVSELESESARHSPAHLCVYKNSDEFSTITKHLFSSLKQVGVNSRGLLQSDYEKFKAAFPDIQFTDVSDALQSARSIKDEQEILHIKKTCSIADAVMEEIPDMIFDGMTENELAAEIDYHLIKEGAEKPAFDTISSFEKNTAEPHYSHGELALKKGDFLLCDFGACFRRYNSDITRTFVFGNATSQQKEMYDVVAQAQQIGLDAIRPGVGAHTVHNAVHSYIEGTSFKGRFIHSTGHALGLAVHDGVGFSAENTIELKENMVLTVEPGVYIPGVGGVRIEDDVLIKRDGVEILTHASRLFQELK